MALIAIDNIDNVAKKTPTPLKVENLPWENNKPQHSGNSAAAFLQNAARHLASPAVTGSSVAAVPAGSLAVVPPETGFPCVTVLAGSPAVPLAETGCSGLPDFVSEIKPSSSVLADSVGEGIKSHGESHSPHQPHPSWSAPSSDVPPLPWGQKKVLDSIKTYPGISVPRLSKATGIPAKSIERHIAALIDQQLIEHRGSKKTGGYYTV